MPDIDQETTPAPAFDIDAILGKYIELRDLKATMKAEYDAAVAPVQEAMDRVERILLSHMQQNNSTGIKTSAGTAYIKEVTGITVADWDSFLAFVKDRQMWNMLNHAANKTGVQEFLADQGELPPGLNMRVERSVGIRRA